MAQKTSAQVKVNRVLVLVDATPKGAKVVLRALHGWETQLAEHTLDIAAEEIVFNDAKLTGDHAKMIAIIKAMKRLMTKLPRKQRQAQYQLVIVQSSQTAQHWLTNATSRKAELGKVLGGYVDRLRQYFPNVQFEQRDRSTITRLMNA